MWVWKNILHSLGTERRLGSAKDKLCTLPNIGFTPPLRGIKRSFYKSLTSVGFTTPLLRAGPAMAVLTDARQNRLLAALPQAVLQRWLPQLERVDLPLGGLLHESGDGLSHVWFPTTAIVSLLGVTKGGASAEIAVVGNEGYVGGPLFMGDDFTPRSAVVHSAGECLVMKAHVLEDEIDRAGPALHLLLLFGQALVTQIGQTAACNRHHGLDRQLCRWLLMSLDRLQGSELAVTQEHIAHLLGVRREGVNESAVKLQRLGLIRYARGRVRVLDRKGLEERVCECYRVVKKEYERLLATTASGAPTATQGAHIRPR